MLYFQLFRALFGHMFGRCCLIRGGVFSGTVRRFLRGNPMVFQLFGQTRRSCALAAVLVLSGAVVAAEPPISFSRDIKGILSNRCGRCHGPDSEDRHGGGADGLRLDTFAGAAADLGGHAAIVPGKPADSELMARISTSDPDVVMPPPESGAPLSPREVELFRRWIAAGAVYEPHWAYVPPQRPKVPAVNLAAWPHNDIDRFILATLEAEGLTPLPAADRITLARRLALDLTGLPPTPEEVDAFVADEHTEAVDRFIDRLLSHEGYGEHMARQWLDLARYADSAGYADDRPRSMWGWRDWVIRAYDTNMPFDEFTIRQLAGDLLPNASDDDRIATAFHRNTLTNSEGGTIDEEFRVAAVVDRVNTTMSTWMGTTMACAQCHDHKYDPLSQREYFGLYAILNQTADSDQPGEEPVLTFFTAEQRALHSQLQLSQAAWEQTLATDTCAITAGCAAWEREFPANVSWAVAKPVAACAEHQAGTIDEQGTVRLPKVGLQAVSSITVPLSPGLLAAVRLDFPGAADLPAGGSGHSGNFVLSGISAWIVPLPASSTVVSGESPAIVDKHEIVFATAVADRTQSGFDPTTVLRPAEEAAEKVGGWAPGGPHPASLTLVVKSPLEVPPGAGLVLQLRQRSKHESHTVGIIRIATTHEPRLIGVPTDVAAILGKPLVDRTAAEAVRLADHYRREVSPELEVAREAVKRLTIERAAIAAATVPVLRELPAEERRVTKLQHRGNWSDLGPEVAAAVPAVFASPNSLAASTTDRMALAQWLVDPANPLTPRVVVNRIWERLFGIGIVSTSEEFGAQGERPSHPEMLDWLACELVERNWDTKAIIRLIVSTAAYQQTSKCPPELVARDPENRLLACGPRVRLSAEVIRDQALAAAGLLSKKKGGPSVNPPQPTLGLSAAFGGGIDWTTSTGEDRYRRALYTTWRRSNPYASMATFDAPNREVCTLRRLRTNTPLQALVTLNDPVYVEAAQGLARRMIREAGSAATDRAARGFRLVLSRQPTAPEITRLVQLHDDAAADYRGEVAAATLMATEPLGPPPSDLHIDTPEKLADLAAWTVVANVLLNLDETFMCP